VRSRSVSSKRSPVTNDKEQPAGSGHGTRVYSEWVGISTVVRKLVGGNATRAAIPGFLATIAIEYVALRRRDTVELDDPTQQTNVDAPVGYETRDAATSMAMGLGSLVINGFAGKAFKPADSGLYARRIARLGSSRGSFLLAVVAWDLAYYWNHRLSHEHRLLWASHVNHHSSERYNLSTALRQSWTGFITHWVYMPLFALGFSPSQVARAGELNLLYQYWVHTETIDRLPDTAERLLSTASHHRVHHGANPQYLDRNYGGILIIWDRLFGTFEPEVERARYGLTENIDTFNPLKVATHEWRAMARDVRHARSWRERAGYVFGRPGWAPVDQFPKLVHDARSAAVAASSVAPD